MTFELYWQIKIITLILSGVCILSLAIVTLIDWLKERMAKRKGQAEYYAYMTKKYGRHWTNRL